MWIDIKHKKHKYTSYKEEVEEEAAVECTTYILEYRIEQYCCIKLWNGCVTEKLTL